MIYKLVFVSAAMIWIGGSNKLVTVCQYKGPAGDYVNSYVPYKSYCKPELKVIS